MDRFGFRLFALVLCCTMSLVSRASAQAQPQIPIALAMNAPGSGNWPVYIALAQNFFSDEGLKVTTVLSGSNVATINVLATADANIGLDGSDIEIAATTHGLPIKIVAPEFGPNPYTVLVTAGINTWADLKGKSVTLGSPQDVSSLSFFKMAAMHQLQRSDFTVYTSASSSSRFDALMSGTVQATVLSQPFDILAEEKGFHRLDSGAKTLTPWADTSFAINTKWAAANRAAVVHFVRALKRAVRFGYSHKAETVAALVTATNIAATTAAKAYDLDFTQLHVFDINDRVDLNRDLLAMGEDIRAAGAITTVPPIGDFFDASYLREAGR